MTPAERKLTACLLKLASEEFSDHGCNDFSLRKDGKLTDAEAKEIVATINKWDKQENPVGFEPMKAKEDYTCDWLLMDMMADKIAKEG